MYIDIYTCLLYIHISKLICLLKCLSIPSVPQLQKLSLYLKLCVSRIRHSFYVVIVQKLKAIRKVVFVAIK